MKLILLLLPFLFSCASTTEKGESGVGRGQLLLIPSSQITQMAAQGYDQDLKDARAKNLLDQNPAEVQRVQSIMKRLIPVTGFFRKDAPGWAWESHVLTSPELNAYCMPGGKIIFYSTIIEKLQLTDGEIAAIMGHEITHALREHGREQMSIAAGEQGFIQLAQATGYLDPKYAGAVSALTNVAINLRFSRRDETEADEIGLELMSRAGFDPREALNLWRKMAEASKGKAPPELLSDHPADARRIDQIQALLPKMIPLYEKARQ